jgi:hypothetical protein
MSKIKDIIEGWGRLLFQNYDDLAPGLKERVEARLSICDECKIRNGVVCDPTKTGTHEQTGKIVRGCGCHLRAKAMAVNSSCPLGKW